jgi:hypothetical protein
MAAGRPNTYDLEICKEICNQVANGLSIKSVLSSNDSYPTFQTWCNWKRANKELFDLYINALQDKAEYYMEEMYQVYCMLKSKEIDPSTANVLLQQNKWLTAKFYPKMFGDKVQQEHSGEIKGNMPPTIVFVDSNSDED